MAMRYLTRCVFLVVFALAASIPAWADPYDGLIDELLVEVEKSGATVAVTPFDSPEDGSVSESLVRSVGDEVIDAITEREVVVVERENMDRVVEEIKLQMSGLVAADDAAELGQALGADYIISGTVREFRQPEIENPGLRIRTRIVSVETAEILATASTEVEKSDIRTAYEPRGRRSEAEYPTFLGILAGATFPVVRYPDIDEDAEAYEERLDPGFTAAIRHVPQSTGFLGNSREFHYERTERGIAEVDALVHTFRYNSQVFVRLPMWRYAPTLPRLSNLYFGLGAGAALTYHVPEADDYLGLHVAAHGFAGFVLALSPNWGLDVQYRLSPRFASYGWFGFGSDDIDTLEPIQIGSHTVMAGFSFMP
jgi:TolB-like protein